MHRERAGPRARGFTLIELVIAMAVIAILVAIALPAYNDSVRKGRRGVVKTEVVQIAQTMERCYSAANTYVGCIAGDTLTGNLAQSPQDGGGAYTVALSNVTATTYTLTATRVGGQAEDICGDLGINQAGVRTVTAGDLARCW